MRFRRALEEVFTRGGDVFAVLRCAQVHLSFSETKFSRPPKREEKDSCQKGERED